MSLNKVILIGNLGQDPELKTMPSGDSVCNFSVATKESWNDKQTKEKKEKTTWHKIVVYGKQAETCNQYLKRGSQLYLEGKISVRTWDDEDGNKKTSNEIVVESFRFLGERNETREEQQAVSESSPPSSTNNYKNTDIPF